MLIVSCHNNLAWYYSYHLHPPFNLLKFQLLTTYITYVHRENINKWRSLIILSLLAVGLDLKW